MKTLVTFLIVLLLAGGAAGAAWYVFMLPNVNPAKKAVVKIPTGAKYEDVLQILRDNHVLQNVNTFDLVSKYKGYPNQIKPGYYVLARNLNNRQIVNLLKAGIQTPVSLNIYNIRTKEEFAGLVSRSLEIDSAQLLGKLNDSAFCQKWGLDTANILSHFILDDYEMLWTTHIDAFIEKMDQAYAQFWTAERQKQAAAINLTPTQVTILASIVEKEVMRDAELPRVAGVYLNRLKLNMHLDADPTLIFASREFNTKRVGSRLKELETPYNTYHHKGLIPGPICIPYQHSIEAVLNAEKNKYLYFCADPSLNGYQVFSETKEEQDKIARAYRKKLDSLNIHGN